MKPFFSIGVTTYNRREMLKQCLASVIAQGFKDFEVIVGNDYTKDVLGLKIVGIEDSRIRYINHTKNLGEIGNMNALLAVSQGRYFTWLADDDMYENAFLEAAYNALIRYQFPQVVFNGYSHEKKAVGGHEDFVAKTTLFSGNEFLRRYLKREINVQGCTGLFEREYLIGMGGIEALQEGFSPYSDDLLAIRAGQLEKVAFVDAPLYFFRTHENSMSFTSGNIDAYRNAQTRLLKRSVRIMESVQQNGDFCGNLYFLIKRCMRDYISVVRKSGSLHAKKLVRHLVVLMQYGMRLGKYRWKFAADTIRGLGWLFLDICREKRRNIFFKRITTIVL